MTSTYLISIFLVTCLVCWPEETINSITMISLKIQVFYLNYRMKFMAWQMHRRLVRLASESGLPSPGPFTFVNIWDRDKES